MPPPTILRYLRARSMNSPLPQRREPTGAASPLHRLKATESTARARVEAETPSTTAALKIRAPARWTGNPRPVSHGGYRLRLLLAQGSPTAAVMGVLQTDQPGAREVNVLPSDRRLHFFRAQAAHLVVEQ